MRFVVKLGGSLIETAPGIINMLLEHFETRASSGKPEKKAKSPEEAIILIVPGGGLFADAVRAADIKYGLGKDASHWMAVLAMEQYAYYLSEKSKAKGMDSIEELSPGVSILFPYRLLKARDPLPHSWDVTSDTIAAWVAKETGAEFVKVTDVDGIFCEGKLLKEVPASLAAKLKSSCTDSSLPTFLEKNHMECLIINGKYPERVIRALCGKPVPSTVLKGNV